jgi:hypothetical protein
MDFRKENQRWVSTCWGWAVGRAPIKSQFVNSLITRQPGKQIRRRSESDICSGSASRPPLGLPNHHQHNGYRRPSDEEESSEALLELSIPPQKTDKLWFRSGDVWIPAHSLRRPVNEEERSEILPAAEVLLQLSIPVESVFTDEIAERTSSNPGIHGRNVGRDIISRYLTEWPWSTPSVVHHPNFAPDYAIVTYTGTCINMRSAYHCRHYQSKKRVIVFRQDIVPS